MDVYIDYKNLCSYLESKSKDEDGWKECNEVLRKYFNIYFNFDEDKLNFNNEDRRIKLIYEKWSTLFTRGRGGLEYKCGSNFPTCPIKSDIHNSFNTEQLSSIYMLDRVGVKEWAEKGVLLVAPVGKELDVIKKLQINNKFEPTRMFPIKILKDWSKFGENSSPCTDIIIADPYIFAQKEENYEVNILALLDQLCHAKGMPINIVIFTYKYYIENQNKEYPDFYDIISKIKKKIDVEPNVTIVTTTGEHDRTIFTNYKLYTSGDSFKYFDNNGEHITKGRTFSIISIYDSDNKKLSSDFIEDMQKVIDGKGKNCILGDKKSNFLKFPEVSSCGGNIAENVNESEPNISKSN